MINKYRISTNIGTDKKVTFELKNSIDLLEILSLKFTQEQTYISFCSDYGVVCGRISANNGLGIPNAKVSIFIPLTDEDLDDPVISKLYPYTEITDKNEDGYRYNLLPNKQQHSGHESTGTFFDQEEILTEEAYLEVFEKYYKYTVKTNESGDFMIWGVPLGYQTLNVDVDLSDIGCFSLRPDDFIQQGAGVDQFKNNYKFKSSKDIDSLPQIVNFQKTIEVYPFWGNKDLCEIGITRSDFDLSNNGINIEPKTYFIGSIFSDQDKNTLNKNCKPKKDMGNKCELITEKAIIEILRFTNEIDNVGRPTIEKYELEEELDEDGSFVLSLPTNLDYIYTNEFGEQVVTNDSNKGIPTAGIYRFRITMKNNELGRVRTVASYLVPNIREYKSDIKKSYAWSTDIEDYPNEALDLILNTNSEGEIVPQDYFSRMTFNKVYTLSSFMGGHYHENGTSKETFLGLKQISPRVEDDCDTTANPIPVNFAVKKTNFSILLAKTLIGFERLMLQSYISILQTLTVAFGEMARISILGIKPFGFLDSWVVEPMQRFGTLKLSLIVYPDCESCESDYTEPDVDDVDTNDIKSQYTQIGYGVAQMDIDANVNPHANVNDLILDDSTIPGIAYTAVDGPATIADLYTFINSDSNNVGRYYILNLDNFDVDNNYTNFLLNEYDTGSSSGYSHNDENSTNNWINFNQTIDSGRTINYAIYDIQRPTTTGNTAQDESETIPSSCFSYNSLYDESIAAGTYCTDDYKDYTDLSKNDININVCTEVNNGQIIARGYEDKYNPCDSCGTHSGFSEFRAGTFTIIPSSTAKNFSSNILAIEEYSRRKLINKMFCEGLNNYAFTDNWLSGTLYFFPFKAKVRWDDEESGDLNFARTKYCKELLTFNDTHKLFYYRSTPFNSLTNRFEKISSETTLGHPTTIVDLGPRDEFVNEICTNPNLDPNCAVARNIGNTSAKNFKDMIAVYMDYRMSIEKDTINPSIFYKNYGYSPMFPIKMRGNVLNGDLLQLISMANEAGIEEFDLENRNYVGYDPNIINVNTTPDILNPNSEAFPLNLVLDDQTGLQTRLCLNGKNYLDSSTQNVPFFLWDKQGEDFGIGFNQSWAYDSIQLQPLQGMTYNYKFNYINDYKYVLFPMTKDYSGKLFDNMDNDVVDVVADVESSTDIYTNYSDREEGFKFLQVTVSGTTGPIEGYLYTRVGDAAPNGTSTNWVSVYWTNQNEFYVKPTESNYNNRRQILSTPFMYYFGLRPGNTAIDKFIDRFGPKNAFNNE